MPYTKPRSHCFVERATLSRNLSATRNETPNQNCQAAESRPISFPTQYTSLVMRHWKVDVDKNDGMLKLRPSRGIDEVIYIGCFVTVLIFVSLAIDDNVFV